MTLTILNNDPAQTVGGRASEYAFRLTFRRPSDGKVFPGGDISDSYFQLAREQSHFHAFCKGILDDLGAAETVQSFPIFAEGSKRQVTGMKMAVEHEGRSFEKEFGLEIFEAPAQAELERLIKSGDLGEDKKAVFEVFAERIDGGVRDDAPEGREAISTITKIRRKPVPILNGRLADWLDGAVYCAPKDESQNDDIPLLILKSALDLTHEYAFKSQGNEAGAMLMGHLYRQMEPAPVVFGVIDAVLELRHAKHEKFSLTLTPETYTDLNRQLELRQKRLGRPNEVPLILAHSHGFLPSVAEDGEARCPNCPLRPTCQLTSSFYSAGDVRFHTGLFGKQPWVAGMVIGLSPREERDVRVFCLEGTRSRERGYYTIHHLPKTQE